LSDLGGEFSTKVGKGLLEFYSERRTEIGQEGLARKNSKVQKCKKKLEKKLSYIGTSGACGNPQRRIVTGQRRGGKKVREYLV